MSREAILIVGAGAMACLYGGQLAPVAEVTLLDAWAAGLASIRENGIRIERGGATEVARVRVARTADEAGPARYALVLVKSWQTADAARVLRHCLTEDGLALTLQNGLGNLEILQDSLGPARAAQGVTMYGATLLAPGWVRPGGAGPTIVARHPRLDPLVGLMLRAGFDLAVEDDVRALVWGKLAINAGINPVAALLGLPNGALPSQPDARWLMQTAAAETQAVAQALGIRLPYADAAERVVQVAEQTGDNTSSMLQDMQRGAATEIDAINGAVAEHGRRAGCPAPVNEALWRMVRAAAARKGADDASRHDQG